MKLRMRFLFALLSISGIAGMATSASTSQAQSLSGEALVSGLRAGGYVIVMRHASSPVEAPDEGAANPDNVERERQLDAPGRAGSTAMGETIRALGIPIGPVLSSPTYRARETARFAGFADLQVFAELGDRGRSMQGVTGADAAWLRDRVGVVSEGTNTLLVTHNPNIAGAFPDLEPGVADGESVVFRPDGQGGATPVGRIRIEQWPPLR
jgi:phosphohistidine phosphatase SixA